MIKLVLIHLIMVASLFSTSVSISQEFVKQGEYGTLYFRDIDVHITDIKKDMVWGDTNQETLSTTSVSRVEYTKGSSVLGEECKSSTLQKGCSSIRPFIISEKVLGSLSNTKRKVLTFHSFSSNNGVDIANEMKAMGTETLENSFFPLASHRIYDHNGNIMQIMRTPGTMMKDFVNSISQVHLGMDNFNGSNKDNRLISVMHKENITFGLTEYKTNTIKNSIKSGLVLEDIYYTPDFWKNMEDNGIVKFNSQPLKGNRVNALGFLNYGDGCNIDTFFFSSNYDSESTVCKYMRESNSYLSKMETEIEMDTLVALVSGVTSFKKKRKTFCQWIHHDKPKGTRYVDAKTGKTIYLDIKDSYDFSNDKDNVIMEVLVVGNDGKTIVDTRFLKILKIETGMTTNRGSINDSIVIKYPRKHRRDLYMTQTGRPSTNPSHSIEFDNIGDCEAFLDNQYRGHISNRPIHRIRMFRGYVSTLISRFPKLSIRDTNILSIFDVAYGDYKCYPPMSDVSKFQLTVEILKEEEDTTTIKRIINIK